MVLGGKGARDPDEPRGQLFASRIASCAVAMLCRTRPAGTTVEENTMDDYALVLERRFIEPEVLCFSRPPERNWQLEARGQIEGIGTSPRLYAKARGRPESLWTRNSQSAVQGRQRSASRPSPFGCDPNTAARVSSVLATVSYTAGEVYRPDELSRQKVLKELYVSLRSPRCTSRTISRRSKRSIERLPDVPQVACFDTSFHRGQSRR